MITYVTIKASTILLIFITLMLSGMLGAAGGKLHEQGKLTVARLVITIAGFSFVLLAALFFIL